MPKSIHYINNTTILKCIDFSVDQLRAIRSHTLHSIPTSDPTSINMKSTTLLTSTLMLVMAKPILTAPITVEDNQSASIQEREATDLTTEATGPNGSQDWLTPRSDHSADTENPQSYLATPKAQAPRPPEETASAQPSTNALDSSNTSTTLAPSGLVVSIITPSLSNSARILLLGSSISVHIQIHSTGMMPTAVGHSFHGSHVAAYQDGSEVTQGHRA
ncbi:hypothetical protein EJ05DRAFT_538061 [Pseudovirgaria hyperparasitica]|uniref:Uncharacterized protein n=1 Tax=Pseudovirgaria hyperparasitica TaxID=470096 RepID=A0A6A6W9X3_9PEZI|nr:uncharacterized protein EJ05DRAFT_538061 [Pseudovirgaria hyperparasitica]KAF2758750.1 hypothetical protein EJ05DRAFT_538061 [Pseudovirgaria hyperparasitica]